MLPLGAPYLGAEGTFFPDVLHSDQQSARQRSHHRPRRPRHILLFLLNPTLLDITNIFPMAASGASAAKRSTNGQRKSRTKNPQNKKPTAPNIETNDIESLEQHRDAGKAQWSLSENTTSAYAGQVKRAKEWLAALVKARRAATTVGDASVHGDGINVDELSKAFDEPPNRYAPYALELLLTEKCLVEGKSISTAQSAYSAMKNYWKTM